MFIKLFSTEGVEAHFNIGHIVFFMWDATFGGSLLRLTHGIEQVKETPQEIERLIAELKV
jgi:hypothetical protein